MIDDPSDNFEESLTPVQAAKQREQETDPRVYLTQMATPEEQRLMAALDRSAGQHTPYMHFAKLALRVAHHAGWIRRADGLARRLRRYLIAGATGAAVNLSAVGIYVLNRHDEAVAERERSSAQERAFEEYRAAHDREIGELRLDIRELRRELHRIGSSPTGPDASVISPPEKLSLLETTIETFKGTDTCYPLEPVTR